MKSPAISSWLPCFPIGSGSSAVVYLAISLPDGKPFALKSAIAPSSSSSSSDLRNELRLLLPLSSAFVLRCFGADFSSSAAGAAPRHLFLEFMDGGSLSSLIKRCGGRLDERRARRIARSVAQGLEYLHSNGVVHCDIKSQNILIGSSGVKIADFGAAKRGGGGGEAGDCKADQFRGTPLWMAPEVVQGVEQEAPSDIWSFGCTVVEMLQGRPPWGYMSDISAALFKLGRSGEDPPLPSTISDDARDFLRHCLRRDPRARWSASELLQHPFLCDIPGGVELKHEQPSPRSTLDFLPIHGSDTEDETDRSKLSTVAFRSAATPKQIPIAARASTAARPSANAFDGLDEQEWITVKMAGRSCGREAKQMPFMKSEDEHVTRGCDVSLDAAKFLRSRKALR